MKRIWWLCIPLLLIATLVFAEDYTQSQVWVNAETITAPKLNADIAGIITQLNDLENENIKSNAAIAYTKLNLTGGILNADINASAAIAFSKLAALTDTYILVGNGSNVATAVVVSGYLTLANDGVATFVVASEAEGDILFRNASAWVRLAKGSALQLLRMNSGTTAPEWVAPSGLDKQIFTSSGTFTCPAGVTTVYVTMIGGGGGGGWRTSGGGGGGGGSAAYVIKSPRTVTPASGYTVTVGAGGIGRKDSEGDAAVGGSSIFDAGGANPPTAPGGGGGLGAVQTGGVAGIGLAPSGITAGVGAADGHPGADGVVGGGGGGAGGAFGGTGGTGQNAGAGTNGIGYGSGGAGGEAADGGDGAPGIVIVEW